MKKYFILSIVLAGLTTSLVAQERQITLEEIWGGAFGTEGMDVLHSMKNGKQYSILNMDRKSRVISVDKYDYNTLEKVETIVSTENLDGIAYFTSYEFSGDESKVLLATDVEPVYRHSRLGIYYMYDIQEKKIQKIADHKIQEPTFSPDGKKVAFVFNNNIYIKDLMSGETSQITDDGEKNKIINGVTDWVYEEEFAFVRAFEWNADGTHLAYIRFDESKVPEFSMDVYGNALYPVQQEFKYPKAGESNAEVSLLSMISKAGIRNR